MRPPTEAAAKTHGKPSRSAMTPATSGRREEHRRHQGRPEADVRGPLLRTGRELEHDVQSRHADRRHLDARQGEDGGEDSDGGRDQREDVRGDSDHRPGDQHQPMPGPVGEEAEDEVARDLAREEHAGERRHPPGRRLPGPQGIDRVEAPRHGADRGEGAGDEEPAQVAVAREQGGDPPQIGAHRLRRNDRGGGRLPDQRQRHV